jgi:hypothetical protein
LLETASVAKEHLEFDVELPVERVHELCRTVVAERRWFVDELGASRLMVRTGQPGNVIKAPPISISIGLQAENSGTRVRLDGKFPGKFGTWARNDIRKRLVAFRESLEYEVKTLRP